MQQAGRLTALTIAAGTASFYGWQFLCRNDEYLVSVGVCALQLLAGIFSLTWLTAAYRRTGPGERNFWLLLGVGVSFFLLSNLIWFYSQMAHGAVEFSDISFVLWLFEYIGFLTALIYKLKRISAGVLHSPYIFSISVFMITTAAISIHYLILPVVAQPDESLVIVITSTMYAITSLSIMFVTIILYYLMLNRKEKNSIIIVVIAFIIQVSGDSTYVYLYLNDIYTLGNVVDLLWQLSISLIGVAAYARTKKPELPQEVADTAGRNLPIFPYVIILLLIILVSSSYNWDLNFLSSGLIIATLLVIGRQFVVMNKNGKLLREYKYLAYHDSLTGLNNREQFHEDLGKFMEKAQIRGLSLALLLIDLDRFKAINDTLGHQTGDMIIKQTAERFQNGLTSDALLYRLGGDEFIMLLNNASEEKCYRLAQDLLDRVNAPYQVNGHDIDITPSIGICMYPQDGGTGEDLLKHVDSAMYHAKYRGTNSYRFYNAAMNEIMKRKVVIENGLRKAIEKDQLSLVYQPKFELHSRKIVGMEALVRWNHPDLGYVSPAEFIPVAEETNLIVSIGEWVLRTACKQNKLWQDAGFAPLCVSVNVSVRQFQQDNFQQTVMRALEDSRLSPKYLELEITESVMQDVDVVTSVLATLRKYGVRTSIDDFGKGYSSLYILQTLPIDAVKIDKLFIDAITVNTSQSMIKTIIDLGRNLNLTVVAEGIENEQQLQVLKDHACHIGQGYLFSKPVHAKEFERMLSRKAV